MNIFSALQIAASGLTAQRQRVEVISSNLANADTTRTEQGGPYRRKDLVFTTQSVQGSFQTMLGEAMDGEMGKGVRVAGIYEDNSPFIRRYEPGHPDADAEGYVLTPNLSPIEEMVNLISATRSFEANTQAISAIKEIAQKSLEIGK
jgi:flagellar basal-body rod protein FlgC